MKEEQGALAKAALDNTKIPVYPSPGSSTQLKIPVSVEVGLISTVEMKQQQRNKNAEMKKKNGFIQSRDYHVTVNG